MDTQAVVRVLNPHLPQRRAARPRMLPLAVALAVFVVLAGIKEIGGAPKELVISLMSCFLVCALAFGMVQRGTSHSATAYSARLIVLWTAVSAGLFGAVYQLDRGGWNWFLLSGYNQAIAEQRPDDVRRLPAEFVVQHPAFGLDADDATRIVLHPGDHSFSRTIVVPKDTVLTIEPGTIVRMRVGCSLIAYSPIIARGTPREPIVFMAQNRWFKWGVVGLVNAGPAVFEHVRFEHARQALVNGKIFPAGLTAIDTDIEIRHCEFTNMFGKDAINVRRGRVLMHDNRVQQCFKDGVDLDAASGEILRNFFIECGDEGIDLCDNIDVDVRENTVLDRHGGRIDADHDLDQIKRANTLGFSRI